MIRAHALYFTLVIALIIAMLSGSLILVAYYYRIHSINTETQNKLLRNLSSGTSLLLSSDSDLEYNKSITLDLFDEQNDSITIQKIPWGLFDIGIINSFKRKNYIHRAFMYGFLPKNDGTALYLQDLNRPLSLCGKTILRGTCYLPQAGVKRAYIAGKSYQGSKLLYGTRKKSNKKLPKLQKVRLDQLIKQLRDIKAAAVPNKDINDNSFLLPTTIEKLETTTLDTIYSGNLILYSPTHVTITNDAILHNTIVYAESITVEKGFEGKAQLFAIDSITLEKDVSLNYPSSLGILKNEKTDQQPFISVGENSTVTGIIFTLQAEYDRLKTMISLNKGSIITGQVYSDGFIDLQGQVLGAVYTHKFSLKTPASVYENHLLDAEINIEKLPEDFVSSSLFDFEDKKKIITWLK